MCAVCPGSSVCIFRVNTIQLFVKLKDISVRHRCQEKQINNLIYLENGNCETNIEKSGNISEILSKSVTCI